jgi:hypothetical protein
VTNTITVRRTTTEVSTETVERTETVQRTLEAKPVIYVPGPSGSLEYKPRDVAPGGSAPGYIVKRWLSYGDETATAEAEWETNDCVPNCAAGTRERTDITIVLSRIGPCKGSPAYLQASVQKSDDPVLVGDSVDLEPYCSVG